MKWICRRLHCSIAIVTMHKPNRRMSALRRFLAWNLLRNYGRHLLRLALGVCAFIDSFECNLSRAKIANQHSIQIQRFKQYSEIESVRRYKRNKNVKELAWVCVCVCVNQLKAKTKALSLFHSPARRRWIAIALSKIMNTLRIDKWMVGQCVCNQVWGRDGRMKLALQSLFNKWDFTCVQFMYNC